MTQVLVNEYLIEIKTEIKKTYFIDSLAQKLDSLGFTINISEKKVSIKSNNISEDDIICYYDIRKIYHDNNNRQSIFFLLKVFYNLDLDDKQDNVCRGFIKFEKSPQFNNIKRFRKVFSTQLENIQDVESIKILQDKYKFCILKKSYPLIYEIENLMRVLIVKTMNFFGKENWENSELPESIQNEIKENRKHLGVFGTDFSHLSKILFDRTENSNIGNVLAMIMALKENPTQQDIKKIKDKVPKSNWEKYFSSIIIEDDIEAIKKQLYNNNTELSNEKIIETIFSDLSDMRNKIAHNNFHIDDDFYEELEIKTKPIINWINNALNKIEQDSIYNFNEKVKDNLSKEDNSLIQKINTLISQLKVYYQLEDKQKLLSYLQSNFYEYDEELDKSKPISKEIGDTKFFIHLRHLILDESKSLSSDEYEKYNNELDYLIHQITKFPKIEEDKIEEDEELKVIQE